MRLSFTWTLGQPCCTNSADSCNLSRFAGHVPTWQAKANANENRKWNSKIFHHGRRLLILLADLNKLMMTHDHLCKVAALAGCLDPAWGLFAADKAFFMHLGGGCCSLCLQMWNWNVKHQRCRLQSRHEVLWRRGRCLWYLWCRAVGIIGQVLVG